MHKRSRTKPVFHIMPEVDFHCLGRQRTAILTRAAHITPVKRHRAQLKVLYHFRTLATTGKKQLLLTRDSRNHGRCDFVYHAAPALFSMMNTVAMKNLTLPPKVYRHSVSSMATALYLLFFSLWVCSLRTFLTIFCSSIRNARTILSLTQLAHLEPPYARWTVFFGRDVVAYSLGRRAGSYRTRFVRSCFA